MYQKRKENQKPKRNNNRQTKDIEYTKGLMIGLKAGLGISITVLRDKFDLLVDNGKSKEEVFAELYIDILDSFQKGYVTLDDLEQTIYEESGMRIEI